MANKTGRFTNMVEKDTGLPIDLVLTDNGDGTYSLGTSSSGGGGGAATIADGADVTQGAIADAAVAAGAAGSISAKLRAISRDIVANIVLKAGSAIIGQVGVDQTTPGTTDSVTVKASAGIGALTETAPASDTASSGLNGRLQRIAQRLTTLLAVFPTTIDTNSGAKSASTIRTVHATDDAMLGSVTETAPASDTASSGLNGRLQRIAQNITTLISSVLKVVGNIAIGAAASGSPVLIGIKDTAGNVEYLFGDTTGRAIVVGAAAAGSAIAGNPVLMAGSDGTNARAIAVSSGGKVAVTTSVAFNDATSTTFNNPDDSSGNARLMGIGNFLYDNTAWTRQRGVNVLTLLSSAARTVTTNSSDQTNYSNRGLILTVDVSNIGTGSITPSIQVKDSVSGNYKTIWTAAAAITTNSTNVYALYPGAAAASFTEAVALQIGRTWRLVLTSNNANSVTASASADMLL